MISDILSRRHLATVFIKGAWVVVPALCHLSASAQNSPDALSLNQCIDYAMQHSPTIQQGQLGISIARTTNSINLAGWLPQVNGSLNATHYFKLPSTLITSDTTHNTDARPVVHTGVVNTVIPEISATQTIFNPQLVYAAKAAPLYIKQAEQALDSNKINIVASVSKAFYNLLQVLEQVNVLKEDTARLNRNVQDTYHQFVGGIVDETDYDEAIISLNTSKGQLKRQLESIAPAYAQLKQYMGYPPEQQFNVVNDTVQMMQEMTFDTNQILDYEKRIEFAQLETAKRIQHQSVDYYRLSFLPTVSAFYNYVYEYENNSADGFFSAAYPYSYIGLSVNLPLFTGLSRLNNIKKARLQEDMIDWQQVNLKSQINVQYTTAIDSYKTNYYSWQLMKDNVMRARNVYRIVSLQYKQGIVAYLNMIVAESNLIAAQIGYINALYALLESKIDLEKAMGDIPYNR